MQRSSGSSDDPPAAPEPRGRDAIAQAFAVAAALLKGDTLHVKDVSDLLGIDPPACRTYIDAAIEKLGALETRKENKRAARMPRALAARPSPEMAVAVAFSASLARLFDTSPISTGMQAALQYFVDASGDAQAYESLHRKFFFVRQGGEMALPERVADLHLITGAILSQNVLRITYQSFDGTFSEYRVCPLSIAVYDHQLYILSRKDNGELHPLRFSRCIRVRKLLETFKYPPVSEFDPSRLFQHSFGIWLQRESPIEHIRVVLDKRWETFARSHRWADDQNVVANDEGVFVDFHVRVCEELVMWALGFGREIRILHPESLRERVVARLHVSEPDRL